MKTILYLFITLTISFTIIWSYNDKDFNLYDYLVTSCEEVNELEKPTLPNFEFQPLELPQITNFTELLECFKTFFEFIFQPLKMIYDLLLWLIEWIKLIFGIITIFGGGLIL